MIIDVEKFFKEMFYNIWQSHDISRIGDYYANNFEEIIYTWNEQHNRPDELHMNYQYMVEQAELHKKNYRDTVLDIKKIIAGKDNHISVTFYSSSIERKTGKMSSRYVCGVWRLNQKNKIDYVWAVVTPYYCEPQGKRIF